MKKWRCLSGIWFNACILFKLLLRISGLPNCTFPRVTVVSSKFQGFPQNVLIDDSHRQLFWSSEENPSEDQLVNEHGRSVYVHQPLLLLCGAISHICYCLQTLYFFKSGPLPRVLKIDGIDENCDPDIIKHSLELLDALVCSFILAVILFAKFNSTLCRFQFL